MAVVVETKQVFCPKCSREFTQKEGGLVFCFYCELHHCFVCQSWFNHKDYVGSFKQPGNSCPSCRTAAKPRRSGISLRRRFKVLSRDKYACVYCGRSAPNVVLEIDHKIPVKRGGSDEMDNLITACFDCNRGKFDQLAA